MALKQDDRALLQLVCERGQSYADLAGLLGISEDEVRAKARAALTELGGADPDAEVGLTDYLLGQADPIGRADAVRYLQDDAEARELATTISTKLQALAPSAALPSVPEPRGRRRKPAAAAASAPAADAPAVAGPAQPASAPAAERAVSLSQHQTRLLVGIAAAGLILVFAILAIVGVFGGGSSDNSGTSADATAAEAQRNITPVKLSPVGNSGVAGRANFGLTNDQLVVDLKLVRPRSEAAEGRRLRDLADAQRQARLSGQPAAARRQRQRELEHPRADSRGGCRRRQRPVCTRHEDTGEAAQRRHQEGCQGLGARPASLRQSLATGDIPLAKGGSGSALGSGSAGASTTTPTTTTPTTTPGG